MDKQLVLRMLDFIEKMELEYTALKAIMPTVARTGSTARVEQWLEKLRNDPPAIEVVRTRWLPLRQRIEEDSSLEEALKQFLQIAPPTKDVN